VSARLTTLQRCEVENSVCGEFNQTNEDVVPLIRLKRSVSLSSSEPMSWLAKCPPEGRSDDKSGKAVLNQQGHETGCECSDL